MKYKLKGGQRRAGAPFVCPGDYAEINRLDKKVSRILRNVITEGRLEKYSTLCVARSPSFRAVEFAPKISFERPESRSHIDHPTTILGVNCNRR